MSEKEGMWVSMKKIGYILGSILIVAILFVSARISIAASSLENIPQNPYVQQYFKEKTENVSLQENATSETLVDPQLEEKTSIATLTEYYNEDIKVANIIKKYCQDTKLIEETTSLIKNDKINVMHAIQKIYPFVNDLNEKKILVAYLERYARDSKDNVSISFLNKLIQPIKSTNTKKEEDLLKQNKESVNANSAITASSYAGSYSGGAAADWAYNHYNTYSTDYPAFNNPNGSYSDCTNFVSQAMHVGGGMPMQGNWYCYKKNSTYPSPINADQLNYSWSVSDPSPWISVGQFAEFWTPKANVSYYSHDDYVTRHETIYNLPIYRGDSVIFYSGIANWITYPSHAMIISGYDTTNKDFLLSGHSNNRRNYPLLSAISNYSEIEFISY